MATHFIQKAIKHPGIEKKRAAEHGISTHEQLERDAKSDNPTLRGRGELGLRFEKGGDLHHGSKPEKPKSKTNAERAASRYGKKGAAR
ncbi:MAG TPA: hypothetical protein VHY10_16340 [Xanthobacteraceae bacterium]|jgi:hypothetical protein|nr:hypothetical protein [Xanthobacteraceae bacterium]